MSVYEKVRESDIDACKTVFDSFDTKKRGFIDFYDLKLALAKMGIKFSHPYVYHKMVAELNENQTESGMNGKINCFDFCKMVVDRRKEEQEGNHDILDAFVAMGGDEDGGGNIDADRLKTIIKDELKMTIDIEGLLKQVDEDDSGEIEFEEFQTL